MAFGPWISRSRSPPGGNSCTCFAGCLELNPRWYRSFIFPRVDSALIREMVKQQAKRSPRRRLLRSWDVRSERDEAEQYAARVCAELKGWSLIPYDPATEGWVDEVRRICLGPSED